MNVFMQQKKFIRSILVEDEFSSVEIIFEDVKPVNEFINQTIERRRKAFGFEEDKGELETLGEVQKLLAENKVPDILFKVQGKHILAHKNILSLRSSYFSNMFSSEIF